MNKLVNRNPVQRFKQGKNFRNKPQKFLEGGIQTYGGIPIEIINGKQGTYTLNGKQYSVPPSLFDSSKNFQFKGVNLGGKVRARNKDFGNSLSDENKQKLISTGFFNDSDFSTVESFQNALNRYLGRDGYGTIKVDNMWGNQTEKAFQTALDKANSPIVGTMDGFKFQNELNPKKVWIQAQNQNSLHNDLKLEESQSSINDQVSNLKLNVSTPPTQTYDRKGIRDYIRSKGLNPYSFSGAHRRALRMVMNGTADNNDKLLVKEMNIFKQGGPLISRNPVERFKQKLTKINF